MSNSSDWSSQIAASQPSENSCDRSSQLSAQPVQQVAGKRPIETAPKDGTEILAWREDCGWFLAKWTCINELRTTSDRDRDELDEETLFAPDWFGGDSESVFRADGGEAPTHWMPLPLDDAEPPHTVSMDKGANPETMRGGVSLAAQPGKVCHLGKDCWCEEGREFAACPNWKAVVLIASPAPGGEKK